MNGYLDKTMLLSLLRQNAEEARIEADEFGGECVANCYASNLLRGDPRVPGIHLTGANDFCSYGERRND